jgi:ABC-type multidrug transport system fused ATPase/permease subunit
VAEHSKAGLGELIDGEDRRGLAVEPSWLRQVFLLVPDLRDTLLTGLAFAFAVECCKIVPPYLLKTVIDWLGSGSTPLSRILAGVTGILAISFVTTFIEDRYSAFSVAQAFRVETDVLRKGHAHLLGLGLAYHEDHPSGDLMQLLNKGSSRLRELLWFTMDQFLGASLQILLTSLVLLFVHVGCGLVFIAFLPVVLYQVHHAGKKLQPYREQYHQVFRQASWQMNQGLLNVRTVMDYVQESREISKLGGLLDRYLELAHVRQRVDMEAHRIRDWLLSAARFSVLFYAVYLVSRGSMSTGSLFLFATLSEKVVASLFRLDRLYSYLGDSVESAEQLARVFAAVPCVVDRAEAEPCARLDGEIQFQNVSFHYRPGRPVLKDLSLSIPARSVIAVVGRSGGGKTTLIKLLSRHYDVTKGSVRVDGTDIRDYRVADYRRKVAVVSQDIQLFDDSVAANIAYGLDADLPAIQAAAQLANAAEFIEQLPQGYETRVGERGLKLSGGQRQRIGIARALLMRPAVLVFDEATSSLDTESERSIQEALSRIAGRHTMILIAHRLSTIETADQIIVVDDGRIVEAGSPAELARREGTFARMRALQALGELRA